MVDQGNRTEDHWHLDKRIPIALIFTILSQAFIFGWFLSNHEARLLSLEKSYTSIEQVDEKVERLTKDSTETKIHLQYQASTLKEIEHVLKNDIEWLPREAK